MKVEPVSPDSLLHYLESAGIRLQAAAEVLASLIRQEESGHTLDEALETVRITREEIQDLERLLKTDLAAMAEDRDRLQRELERLRGSAPIEGERTGGWLNLEELLEHVPAWITIVDGQEVLTWISRHGSEIMGQGRELIQGTPLKDLPGLYHRMDGSAIDFLERPIIRAIRSGQAIINEEWLIEKPGRGMAPFLCSVAPVRDARGGIAGAVASYSDISTVKALQERWESLAGKREEHVRKVDRLVQATERMLFETSPARMLDHIVTAACDLTGAKAGIAAAGDESAGVVTASCARKGEAKFVARGAAVTAETLAGLFQIFRGAKAERIAPDEWKRIAAAGLPGIEGELLGMRLTGQEGVPIGVILVVKEDGGFSDEDETFLAQLATFGSLGLRWIGVRAEAEERMRELDVTITSIADGVIVSCPYGRVLRLNPAASQILGLTERQLGNIERMTELLCVENAEGRRLDPDELPARRAMKGETVRNAVLAVSRPDGRKKWLSTSAAPILVEDGRMFGTVSVFSDITEIQELQAELRQSREKLEERVRRRTDAISKINRILKKEIQERKTAQERIRTYHEELRYLASQLSLTEEKERRRIATELHDNIGQTLAITKIRLDEIRQKAAKTELSEDLANLQNLIGQAVRDTRSVISELSPPALYELGLGAAIETMAENFRKQHAISVSFDNSGWNDPAIGRDLQVLLYQAVRELLWNIVKHARADQVLLSLKADKSGVRIAVEDNGIGFPAGSNRKTDLKAGKFGLFSIRERLSPLGGDLRIDSVPGRTRVTITVSRKGKGS